jgi:hypothetical protein
MAMETLPKSAPLITFERIYHYDALLFTGIPAFQLAPGWVESVTRYCTNNCMIHDSVE